MANPKKMKGTVGKNDSKLEFESWWKMFEKTDGPILDALAEWDRTGKLPKSNRKKRSLKISP